MKKCPSCQNVVDLDSYAYKYSGACEYCGHILVTQRAAQPAPKPTTPQPKKEKGRTGLVVILVLLALFGGAGAVKEIFFRESLTPRPAPIVTNPDPSDIARQCRQFVRDQLKAPTTAEFPSVFEMEVYDFPDIPNQYRVKSYVDAQNTFGAMIRSPFTCEVKYYPANGRWELTYLKIEP